MIGSVPVHVACLGLVGADMVARALRIRLLVSRLGERLSFRDALRLNLLGDAAAELTPFRVAGEPSRVAALLQCGVRVDSALLSVAAELALSYAMVALLVVATSWALLPAWWSSVGPALHHAAGRVPRWALVSVSAAIVVSLRLVPQRASSLVPPLAGIRSSLRTVAGIGSRHLAVAFVLGVFNIVSRVGILWLLVSTLPGVRGAGTILVGSFVLLFGQAFMPTPSGLGVVEMGMLGGAAGSLGHRGVAVLVAWRAYTTILPILLAVVFVLPRFGVRPVMDLLGRRRPFTRLDQERRQERLLPRWLSLLLFRRRDQDDVPRRDAAGYSERAA